MRFQHDLQSIFHCFFVKIIGAVLLATIGISFLFKDIAIDCVQQINCSLFEDIEEQIENIENEFHIDIQYEIGEKAIPELWRMPPASGTAQPIARSKLCQAVQVLSKELKKYPNEVTKRDIESIYLLSHVSFYNTDYGGTSLGKSVYLTYGSSRDGYDDNYFASLLHHELSSVFFHTYSFPREAWHAINPKKFLYAQTGKEQIKAIKEYNGEEGRQSLYNAGFLADYGQSTLENDFNLYAELFFMNPQLLNKLAKNYPRIQKKLELW